MIAPPTQGKLKRWIVRGGLGALMAITGCERVTSPLYPRLTFLAFSSDSGDWVGQGQPWLLGAKDGSWTAATARWGPVMGLWTDYIEVFVQRPSDSAVLWRLTLAAPRGQPLKVGSYENATRALVESGDQPGLELSGDGRGCNSVTGRFEIHALAVGANNRVNRLFATFEQHCEGSEPALHGQVSIVPNR